MDWNKFECPNHFEIILKAKVNKWDNYDLMLIPLHRYMYKCSRYILLIKWSNLNRTYKNYLCEYKTSILKRFKQYTNVCTAEHYNLHLKICLLYHWTYISRNTLNGVSDDMF